MSSKTISRLDNRFKIMKHIAKGEHVMNSQINLTAMKKIFYTGFLLLNLACATSKPVTRSGVVNDHAFELTGISKDPTYGLNEKNPVEVGGVDKGEGPSNERRFLNALAGPNGEQIRYFRAGNCCGIKSENGLMGYALLDNYRVSWDGAKDTVSIYINMYDYGTLKAPVGFTIKNK
jgi:hypothetical protein